jgi:predicted DNA-binding transcriptional regulator AlpA
MRTDVSSDRLIRIGEVMNRTGLGRTSIYVMAKRGAFPRPVKLGPRASGLWQGQNKKDQTMFLYSRSPFGATKSVRFQTPASGPRPCT